MAAGADCVRFSVEAMVRCYHTCKDVWEAAIGEELLCQTEQGKAQDVFTVMLLKARNIGCHVLRKISAACSIFLS